MVRALPRRRPRVDDAYAAADLVRYPSSIEGFGNALPETIYFRRPLLVNRYPVSTADIAPTGLAAIEIDEWLSMDAVRSVAELLADPSPWEEAVERNYEIGRRRFSYEVLRRELVPLVEASQ